MTLCDRSYWSMASCCILLLSPSPVQADNWPQWRGPNGDGICKETRLPSEWSATENIAWKLPLPGMGGATPVVWEDRIFLTSAAGNDIVLLCVSTAGKQLWKRNLGTGERYFREHEGNQASPSPSTDGRHVWAFSGTGDLACFDLGGKEVWHFNAQDRYGKFRIMHGMHITPLLHGDRLYLSLLHLGGMWILALDKDTGTEVWKVERPTDGRGEGRQSYASPCLWHNGSEEYLVVHGCDYTTAHSLSDGKEIWRLGDLNPRSHYRADLRFVASPVAVQDLIVVPTAKNGPVVAVKPDASGAIATGSAFELWRKAHGTPDVPSPLVHDGLLYLCSERGVLTCMEAKTGKPLYVKRLHTALYRASPVSADGKTYLTARDGHFSVVKAGPEFELLAANQLPDVFTASPAISKGRIYLRGYQTLYAIGDGGR